MADAFTRAKFRLLNEALHDARLTPAARLVFYEIMQYVNRVSGDAWPSEDTIAQRLGVNVKTVKRSLAPLRELKYIAIECDGRHNTYRPLFDRQSDEPPNRGQIVPHSGSETGDILSSDRGHFVPPIGDKKGPLTLLSNPIKENAILPSPSSSLQNRAREGTRNDCASGKEAVAEKEGERLRGCRDDGYFDREMIQQFKQIGADGIDVMHALHEIDQGRPRLRLIGRARAGLLTEGDLRVALLAVNARPRKILMEKDHDETHWRRRR